MEQEGANLTAGGKGASGITVAATDPEEAPTSCSRPSLAACSAPAGRSANGILEGAFAVPPARTGGRSPAGYGVCRLCRGPAAEGRTSCWSCRLVCSQLGGRVPRIVPIFLFSPGSGAHRSLVGYKSAPSCAGRSARRAMLETVISVFFERHLRCVLGSSSASAIVVPVPSTIGGRPSFGGRHPLGPVAEAVLGRLCGGEAGGTKLRLAEVLRAGAVPPARLDARAAGFDVLPDAVEMVAGATVLVLDDVFTSGARALSAAAALGRAGATVAAVVPIGRLVRPEHSSATAAFYSDWSSVPWHPGTCAACRAAGVSLARAVSTAAVSRHAA